MSVKRYSGELTLSLTYRDRSDDYEVRISGPGVRHRVFVGSPAHLERAVDSPIAYDRTAHAALSFADNDQPGIGEQAALTDIGWHISRTKAERYGHDPADLERERKALAKRRTR